MYNIIQRFSRYGPEDRAAIGKYACAHGIRAASIHYSRKLGRKISKSSVYSINIAYLRNLRECSEGSRDEIAKLCPKKRGRPLLLGATLDKQVQAYICKIREQGGVVSASIVVVVATGILLSIDKTKLVQFGGHIKISKHWAYKLLARMNFVKRKATTSKSKHSPEDFVELKRAFLEEVVAVVKMEEIPPELILNWDQTGVNLVPVLSWTMDQLGARRVEITGVNDKRQITALFCGTLTGDFLPLQLIYQGKSARCHPHYHFPSGWNITHSPRHWSTEDTMIEYINEIIIPYVQNQRDLLENPALSALVIMDNFRGQITSSINTLLEAHNIHVCLLPPNTTDLLQPLDIAVNKPAKDFLKRKFEEWYSNEVTKQLHGICDLDSVVIQPVDLSMAAVKEQSAKWLVEMYEYIADNPQFVVNGFKVSGIPNALDGTENADESDENEGNAAESDDEFDEQSTDDEYTDTD